MSTNQRLVLYCVNQSEISIALCQPIRDYLTSFTATNEKIVVRQVLQLDYMIHLLQTMDLYTLSIIDIGPLLLSNSKQVVIDPLDIMN